MSNEYELVHQNVRVSKYFVGWRLKGRDIFLIVMHIFTSKTCLGSSWPNLILCLNYRLFYAFQFIAFVLGIPWSLNWRLLVLLKFSWLLWSFLVCFFFKLITWTKFCEFESSYWCCIVFHGTEKNSWQIALENLF